MELEYTGMEREFQAEVIRFVEDNLPHDIRDKVLSGRYLVKDDYVRWQKILWQKGWIVPHWPTEHGGLGWSIVQRHIFDDETCQRGAPQVFPFGVGMIGPTIIAFGNEAQKAKYLPLIRSSDVWWCQGFSEPGAGSDLASLSTRAVRDGDHYVVDGQKTWTSMAHWSNTMFGLFRTDPKARRKQEGISLLLIDMDTPGITVRPIVTLDEGRDVNEVFFDKVRIPVANCIGEENLGWTYAKFLLGYERSSVARIGVSKALLARLKTVAAAERSGGRRLIDDTRFRDKLSGVQVELMGLEITNLRFLAMQRDGSPPGSESSILKLKGAEIQQTLAELLMEAAGPYALPFQPDLLDRHANEPSIGPDYAAPLASTYFNWRKVSIYGGANEVQKNILAKTAIQRRGAA